MYCIQFYTQYNNFIEVMCQQGKYLDESGGVILDKSGGGDGGLNERRGGDGSIPAAEFLPIETITTIFDLIDNSIDAARNTLYAGDAATSCGSASKIDPPQAFGLTHLNSNIS